jgi:hypothetical protein
VVEAHHGDRQVDQHGHRRRGALDSRDSARAKNPIQLLVRVGQIGRRAGRPAALW